MLLSPSRAELAPTKNALKTDLLCAGVGASLLAMVVNDYARLLAERGALESIASRARSYKKCAENGFVERRCRSEPARDGR
ncbi:hypothetical protein EMIT0P43_100207 [Pseudomonas jessenii]